MKLRLPHKFQAALLAAIASVSFTTLSTGTLGAAFFVSGHAFAEDAEEEPSATIDIGDTNLDAQAAMEEEEGTAEKEPGSAPINEAGSNGGPGNNAGLLITESDDIDETALDTVDSSEPVAVTSGSADSTPSDNLGFTSNPYATDSDTSNGSDEFSLTDTAPAAAYVPGQSGVSAEEGDSAAGTGSGSSSNKTTTDAIGSMGGTGSGATGGSVARRMALTASNMLSPVSSLSVDGSSLGGGSGSLPESTMLGAAGAANDQTLHVYILTGQSNSLGAVKSTPLSQSKLDAYFTEGAMLWNANLRKGGDYYVPAAQQAWQDVVPQLPSYSTRDGEPSNLCMGPEYGFTHMLTRLAEDNRAPQVDADHLAIIKFSLDGGGNGYWVKGGSGSSYANMLDAAKRALVAAKDKGFTTISLDGLMYLQGESDNGTEAAQSATRYQAFITNLSTDLKTWMQQESITGVTVSFDTNSVLGEPMLGTTDRQTTNNKFIALAGGNADKNGYGYVYTDDLGNIGDKLHFTGEAQLTIGARYAYAFAVQNNYDVGAVRGANKSAALDTAGAWWMEAMPLSTDVVKWDVSSCSAVNTISSSLTVRGILVEDPYNNAVAITGGVLNIGTAGIELQKGSLSVSSAVNVVESQSWRSQNGFAINTTGNVTIASDATLTLQDGAVVNFHSIAGAGNLTLGTGSGLVSLGMSAQDFAAATPVGEAHYTEGDNGFFNGSRSIITVSGNLVIADGTTLGGMDGLTGAIFSVSDDHHSLYAAATSQTDYFVRSGKITYAAGTNAYAATGLILVDKGSGDACLSLETSLKDNVSIQVSGTGNAIEIAEGVNLAAASLQIGGSGNVALKGNGFYTSNSVSHTGITLDPSNWHGVYMLKGVTIGTEDIIKNCTVGDSYVGLCGVSGVDNKWNGKQEANIWLQDNGDTVAWTWNNGSSKAFTTETFTGKIAGDGTLKKTTAQYKQNYTFEGDISDWTGTLWIADQNSAGTMTYQSAATVINSEIKNTSAQGITLVLGDTLDGTNAYTLNNSANVATLSADGRTLNLGTNEKADGTETVGNLTVSGNTTLDTLTLGSGTTATFGGTTNLAGVNGTGGTLVVGGGNLNVSGSVGGTVAINLQSGSVGNISIASGSNVTLSQADGTYGTVTVAADTTLTLGSALNVADMTFGSGAKLDATVDFMRSVTYSGTSTGYSDNSDTVNGYQQYSDASFTLVTKSAGTAGTVQGAGLLDSWTLVSTADSVVAHGGTVKAGKYYVNTTVDYDAASSTNTAYTGASEMVLNSANATLNLLSNLNANACSGGITTAGGATAIASTINIGSGVTLNANQIIRKGSDTVTLAGSGTFAVAGINSTGQKFNAYDALPAGVSKGTSWFGCLSLNGNIEQLWLNLAPRGSTVRLDGVTGFMGGSKNDNDQIVAEVEIGPGGYTFTTANTGTRNFMGGFSGAGNLVHANQGLDNSPNLVFSSNMENFTGSIINQKASAGFTLNFNTGVSVVNAASIKNNGTAANMLITMNVNDATTFNTLIDKGQGNINLTVASGKSATFNGNTSVSSLSASGADVALGSGASLAVAGATTVSNLSLAGGNTVAFGNGLTYDTLSAEGVSSMSLSGAVSMGEYLMLGQGTLSVNNVQLDLSRDAWDAALDREGSQYSDGESTVNGYATGMKLILARASRIDGAGYAAASGGSLAGMNLSIEVYGAEEDPECSVGGYAQHLVAMGADTSHTYFVNTEAEYDSSSATSGASTRLVMNRANASLSLASNLNSSVCVGGIVVEAQGTSVIVKSGVDLNAGDIHYGDTLTSICVKDQGTLALVGFGGSAIALDRLTLEDGSALDLAALTTFAPAQQPVLLQGMGGGSGMMKVNSNAIGDFSGISLLGDAAPGSPQTVVLATASNGIELGSNVDLKNLVIPEQYQAKLSTQAAEGGGYNLVLTLGAASNDLVWDNASSNGLWDSGNNWHASGTTTTGTTQFSEGDNVQFSSGFANTVALNGDVNANIMTIDNGVTVSVDTAGHKLTVADLNSTGGSISKSGAGTAEFGGKDGVTLASLKVEGGTAVFDQHVTITGNDAISVTNSGTELQLLDGMSFNGTGGQFAYALNVGSSGAKAVLGGTTVMSAKNIGGVLGATIELAENANVTVLGVLSTRSNDNNQNVVMGDGSILTAGEFRSQTLTLGSNAVLNLTGSSNRDSKIVNVTGSGDINVQAHTLTLSGSSNYTGNVTLSNAANLEINATNFGGKIANTGTGTVTMYGTAGQVANENARIAVTKKSGQQLFLAAGSEKAISKVTVAAGDGQWLLAEGIGENTDGLYTDIHLGGKGLILSQPNTTVNIGSLSGVSGTTVQGDYNTGGGRVLAVHQDEDAEYAGIFTSGTNSRSVGLNKYGSSTLTLTGANTSTNALNIYEGAIKLDGADAKWSGAATVYSGGTLELTSSVATLVSNVTINSGGTLTLGNYKDDAVTATNLTLASGSILDLSNLSFTGDEAGEITLIADGTITATDPGSVILNFADSSLKDRATLSMSGNNLVLTFTPLSNDLIWDGTNGAMWDTGNNWHTAGQAAGATAFRTDANVQFTDDYTATATLGNDVTAGNMVVDSGATATVNTAGHSLTATSLTGAEGAQGGNLVKQGAGTATFNGDINLSGIEVQGGTVYVTDTDTTRGNVGEIKSTQGAALELVNVAATISGNNIQQLKGDLTIGNGALVTVTNTDNLDYNSTSTVTVGAGGELHFENARWTVGGNNKLVLAGGSITGTGESSNGALDFMNANTVNVTDDSTISAPIRLRGSNVTFEVADTKNLTIAGLVNQHESGSLTKMGAGTLLLSGANTYATTTTISEGTLETASETALGTSKVTIAAGATLKVSENLTIQGGSAPAVENSGTIEIADGKRLRLHATAQDRQYNLGNVVVDGAATIEDYNHNINASIASINGTVNSNITLFSNHSSTAATWTIGSSPSAQQTPYQGTLTLKAACDQKTGADRVVNFVLNDGNMLDGATLQLENGTTGGTLTNNIKLGAETVKLGGISDAADGTVSATRKWNIGSSEGTHTLQLTGADDYSSAVVINSNVNLLKTGSGKQTLTGDNANMNGTVTVNNGTLVAGSANALGTGAITVNNNGTLELTNLVSSVSGDMSINQGGTLKLALYGDDAAFTASTGLTLASGSILDLSSLTGISGSETTPITLVRGGEIDDANLSDVRVVFAQGVEPENYTLSKSGNNLVLTFTQPAPTEDLIWHGGNGNWSSNNWHTETAPETRVPFADGLSVTFERGEAEVTLTQDVTAPTTTLESGAVVKVVSEQGGNYTLNTTLKGAGTFVLAASQMALPSGVTLSSSTDWHGVVRISGTFNGLNIADLGTNIDSTIEFAGVTGHFADHRGNIQTLSRDVIFTNAGDNNAAVYLNSGYSRNGAYQFARKVSGSGTIEMNQVKTAYHFIFSGDVSDWDGEIKVTNCGSSNDGSWVKFTGSATEVKAAINQTGGTFRVIADADTTFKDDINVQGLEVTDGHIATLGGDVTLTGSQGITGSGAVTVAQGGALTFASGVDTISGTLTVSEGATLKLSEMNDAAITTSGTLTLNSGSTLDLSNLTGITGRELTPITLVQGGTITDTDLGGVNLVFAKGVTGGKLSVQNNALVLTFIEPGKTLIWDNNSGNQTWSNLATDTNWHTPNNLSRHIGFEEYDIVQFNGGGATSVFMAEDVTPARMDVASGKTLTVYTEGHDLTIVQDLNASGATVNLNSENTEGQATTVGGDAVAGNLQIAGGSADVHGYLDVENKATVTSDASLTAEHASNIGTLQVMGGTVDLKGKASVNSVELVGDMFFGSTSRATFESDSFVNALSVNSSELVNKGTMEMQNGAVMLSGTSSITGVGSINTASVRVGSGTTTIDGGQTINVTSADGITGTGTLNLGNATLTADTRSWTLPGTVGVTLTDRANGAKLSATDHTLTVASNITGTGKLVKTGTGTVELTGSNSYTGGTDVNAGTLLISSAGALTGDVNVANGGRLRISDDLVSSAPSVDNLTVAQGGTLRLAGENALAVTDTLTMAAGSTLDLSHINIVDGKTTYTLASGGTFDVDDAVILTFEQGIHPKQGTTPSLTVEGDPGSQTLVLNYVVNTPKNLIWDGGAANWNDDTANWHAEEGTAGSSTFATYDNVIFDGTNIAGREGDDTPTLSENVYATNMTVTKDNDVTVNTNGHRLDVDFLHAAEGASVTKTGNGTALIGIADNGFGADLTVTGGTLTAEYVDINGDGMKVNGDLAANGGTLNVIIGRPETPTNIEFTSDSSVSGLSSILVDENSSAVFNGAVSVPQNVTVEVRDGAELVFGGNTNMSANRWLMTGEGSVHFTGPVTLSEDTNNYEKIDGKLTVTFDDLTQGKENLTLRMQEGTDTNIGTLHLKGVQRCFYLTFQYDEQERGLLEIDTLDVANDGATHGIGSLCSRFDELQGYQQQGSISIAQLTGGGTVSLFNYAYDNNNASGRIGYDSPEVFYVGGKSVESKLFSGNIQLADGGFGVSEANKLKPKHTVLVLEDEIVASQSVIQINNANTGTGDNRNNGKYSNFGIGIDADNVKVQGIEDVALQSGNQVKIFSGSVGTETNASYGSDDTVRTLQLTGKTTDTAATTYSSSAGFDMNVDIVKQGAGVQEFKGDSSKFNGSIDAQDGVLRFLNNASLTVQDLTLAANGSATDGTLAVRSDAAGSNVGTAEVNGTLKANSGAALDSNLTLVSGSVLDVRDTLKEHEGQYADKTDYVGGLNMLNHGLTLQSGAYLSDEDRSALLSMQWGERYDLAYGLSSLTLGDRTYRTEDIEFDPVNYKGNNIEASQFFQNLQEENYYICYSGSGSAGPGGNVGVFYIFKAPEPTTSTLSLLALAALAARRRRK